MRWFDEKALLKLPNVATKTAIAKTMSAIRFWLTNIAKTSGVIKVGVGSL